VSVLRRAFGDTGRVESRIVCRDDEEQVVNIRLEYAGELVCPICGKLAKNHDERTRYIGMYIPPSF